MISRWQMAQVLRWIAFCVVFLWKCKPEKNMTFLLLQFGENFSIISVINKFINNVYAFRQSMMTVDGLRSSLIHASLCALELLPLDCSRRSGGSGNEMQNGSVYHPEIRAFIFCLHIKNTCWIK